MILIASLSTQKIHNIQAQDESKLRRYQLDENYDVYADENIPIWFASEQNTPDENLQSFFDHLMTTYPDLPLNRKEDLAGTYAGLKILSDNALAVFYLFTEDLSYVPFGVISYEDVGFVFPSDPIDIKSVQVEVLKHLEMNGEQKIERLNSSNGIVGFTEQYEEDGAAYSIIVPDVNSAKINVYYLSCFISYNDWEAVKDDFLKIITSITPSDHPYSESLFAKVTQSE